MWLDNSIVTRCFLGLSAGDVFDELFKLAPEKVNAVKEVREIQVPSSPGRLPTAHLGRASGDKGEETGPWFTPAVGWVPGDFLSP